MSDTAIAPIELVRGAFDLYMAGEYDALFALAHCDFELHPVFLPRSFRGLAEVRGLFEHLGDPRERWTASGLVFRDVGGVVVVTGRLHSVTGLGTALDLPIAFLFVVEDGKITRLEGHMTLREAMRSADGRAVEV